MKAVLRNWLVPLLLLCAANAAVYAMTARAAEGGAPDLLIIACYALMVLGLAVIMREVCGILQLVFGLWRLGRGSAPKKLS
jgi:hypothetical protein